MSKTSKILLWVLLGVVLVLILSVVLSNMLGGPREVSLTELTEIIETTDEIDSILVDDYIYIGRKGNSSVYEAVGPRGDAGNVIYEDFWNAVKNKGLNVSYTDPNAGSFMTYLIPLIGIILVCVVFWLLIRQTQGGGSKAMSFAKTKARVN